MTAVIDPNKENRLPVEDHGLNHNLNPNLKVEDLKARVQLLKKNHHVPLQVHVPSLESSHQHQPHALKKSSSVGASSATATLTSSSSAHPHSSTAKKRVTVEDEFEFRAKELTESEQEERAIMVSRVKQHPDQAKLWLTLLKYDSNFLQNSSAQVQAQVRQHLYHLGQRAANCVSLVRNDSDVARLWIEIAELQRPISEMDARTTFKLLEKSDVGQNLAQYYIAVSQMELDAGHFDKARQVVTTGLAKRAEPVGRLDAMLQKITDAANNTRVNTIAEPSIAAPVAGPSAVSSSHAPTHSAVTPAADERRPSSRTGLTARTPRSVVRLGLGGPARRVQRTSGLDEAFEEAEAAAPTLAASMTTSEGETGPTGGFASLSFHTSTNASVGHTSSALATPSAHSSVSSGSGSSATGGPANASLLNLSAATHTQVPVTATLLSAPPTAAITSAPPQQPIVSLAPPQAQPAAILAPTILPVAAPQPAFEAPLVPPATPAPTSAVTSTASLHLIGATPHSRPAETYAPAPAPAPVAPPVVQSEDRQLLQEWQAREASNNSKEPKEVAKKSFELIRELAGASGKKCLLTVRERPYIRLETLGRGGSSEVFKVLSPNMSLYALKRVQLRGADEQTVANYINEIELLKRLRTCDNIIRLVDYEIRPPEGLIYLVLELGDTDLSKLIQRQQQKGPLHENFIRFYWQQMLEAVNTIHEHRIIHSDLKPANFVCVNGTLKLIDFGIAKTMITDSTSVVPTMMGTLNYMAPEAIKNDPSSASKMGRASDVWSLGCILYQMVYGRPPFHSISNQLARLVAITDPNHSIAYPPHPNAALVQAMQACLQRNPQLRPTIPELLFGPFICPRC